MALAIATPTKTLVAQTTAILAVAAATGGTGPYTYQWYQSTATGFSPGAGSLISGQTALTGNFSGLTPATTYYYKVIATDTGNSNATVTSSQLAVLTETGLLTNQIGMNPYVGKVDLKVGSTNIIACQVDASQASASVTSFTSGQAVKVVANTLGGPPRVVACTSKSDSVFGFAIFNIKDQTYSAGMMLEVAMWGSCIWLYATGAVTQFAEVCIDVTYVGGVQATGSTATYVGWAIDGSSAAGLVRVMLMPNIAYATA